MIAPLAFEAVKRIDASFARTTSCCWQNEMTDQVTLIRRSQVSAADAVFPWFACETILFVCPRTRSGWAQHRAQEPLIAISKKAVGA